MNWLETLLKRQELRRQLSAFKSALAQAPLSGSIKLPAAARLRLRNSGNKPAGTLGAIIGAGDSRRSIRIDSRATLVIDWVDGHQLVQIQPGFELDLDTGLGRWRLLVRG